MRYLVTAECSHTESGKTLTHRAYATMETQYPEYAQARADALAFELGRTKAKELTRQTYDRETKRWTVTLCETLTPCVARAEKYKPRKLRAHVAVWKPSDAFYRQQAIEYARWLAARDGVALPGRGEIRVDWSAVESKTRKHKRTGWDGVTREFPIMERRIRSVSWGWEEPRYFQRKDGRQGAWLHNEFVAAVTIEIPNWDWQPDKPVEENYG